MTIRRVYFDDPGFRLVACEIRLDGVVVFRSADPERLTTTVEVVHEGTTTLGQHELSTYQTVRARGVGELAYLSGYSFHIRARHSINVAPIGGTCASVTLHFRGNHLMMPINERPSIRFDAEPSTALAVPAHSPDGGTEDQAPAQAR